MVNVNKRVIMNNNWYLYRIANNNSKREKSSDNGKCKKNPYFSLGNIKHSLSRYIYVLLVIKVCKVKSKVVLMLNELSTTP
jgi:hypothetical protein